MKNGDSVKRVIEMLHNSRRQRQVVIERLCDGICTKSMLEKVELGKRTINRNYLNRLLARLGIDQRKYEKYLYHSEYDEWKERNDIINAIEDGRLQQAEELLCRLEQGCESKEKLDLQFCKFVKAQILQRRGTPFDDEKIFSLYHEALLLTVPNAYKLETDKLMLSADEFNLVLECRRREMAYSDVYEIFEIYQGLIAYIDNSPFDSCCKAKIYPKTIVYMYNHIMEYKVSLDSEWQALAHKKMLKYCEHAIELLRENNRSYYLCELLEVYIKLLGYLCDIKEDKKELYNEQLFEAADILETYKGICNKYDIESYMQDCCYLYREEEVYCINDVLHKRRQMLDITMTKLGEYICSARTISRFEKKESNALEGIVDELFLRLGMSNEYINMGIFTKSKKAVDIYEKCRRAINARDGKLSKELYGKLEEELEDNKINKQVLLQLKSLILWSNNEISNTTHIRNIEESIRYTIRYVQMKKKNKPKFFSYPEIQGVHDIGVTLYKKGDCVAGMKKVDVLVKYFNDIEKEGLADAFIGMYEMVMVSQANMAGSAEMFQYSTTLFSKVNRLALKLKRTNLLHYNEYNIAWNEMHENKNIDRYKAAVKRCICLCKLTHNKFYEETYARKLDEYK